MSFKEYRKINKLNQSDVAEVLGIDQSYYSKKENANNFSVKELQLLIDEYKLTLDQVYEYFLKEEGE